MTVLESWYRKYVDLNPAHQPKKEQKKAFCLIFTFQILLKCIQLTEITYL